MANTTGFKARVEYEVTDGTQTTYTFPFSYLRKKFVMVSILHSDATETALEYGVDYKVNDLSVSLTTPAQVGEHIIIYRQTSTDKIVTWNDGSILLARDMNTEDVQMLHLQEEQQDYIQAHSITTKTDSDTKEVLWDALKHRVINVSDPKDPQDVVTKKYMESVSDGFVAKNTTIQNDIKSRQTDVTTRQADVTTKQANVASMKTSVEEIQADVTTKQADVTTKQANVASMKTSVEEIQADVITRQTDVTTKQADVTTKQANVASMKTSVEEIQADVITRQTDVTTKQADVTTRQTDVINRQADVINRQADVVNMQTNISALQAKFNAPTQIFPGTILPWGSSVIPDGYLLCDGSAVSRTTYSELFAQIGTTFGAGDGSTTFNLPDGRNRTMVGKGTSFSSLGLTGGETNHVLSEAEMPPHKHDFMGTTSTNGKHTHTVYIILPNSPDNGAGAGNDNTWGNETTSADGDHNHTFSGTTSLSGGGIAHNNMPPYLVVNWIIKYTSVGKSNADRLYRQDSTVYTQGDVLLGAENLSKQYVLICTTSGTTGSSAPSSWAEVNNLTNDGTAQFVTRPATDVLPVIQVTGDTTLLSYQIASYVNCIGTTTLTVTMPTPASATGGGFVIRNATSVAITLSTPSGNFTGSQGSQAGTLSVPSGCIVGLLADGSNWVITTWENRLQVILPTITGDTTLTEQQLESVAVLSGSSTYTVTLPAPTTPGHTLLIRNAGSVAMTLSTPSGIFDGPNGTSLSTMPLPSNVVCGLLSDGTNWVVESYQVDWNDYYTKLEEINRPVYYLDSDGCLCEKIFVEVNE